MKRVSLNNIILFLLSIFPFYCHAFDFEKEGIYYDIISSAPLQVAVTNNVSSSAPINTNTSYSGEIIIPASISHDCKTYEVAAIGSFAFGGLNHGCKISKISIPASVTTVDSDAFENCEQLIEISGGENIASIGDNAFYSCSLLQNFKFSDCLTSIGAKAFYNCFSLSNLIFNDSLSFIDDNAFNNCAGLKNIVFGKNLSFIGNYAFAYCSALFKVFFTSPIPPSQSNSSFYSSSRNLKYYVPEPEVYNFGEPYISFSENNFTYTGICHEITWNNNVSGFSCTLSDNFTEINAGEHQKSFMVYFKGTVDFSVEIPYSYTIAKAPLTLIVENVERKYGEENPDFSCVGYGFVNDETFANFDTRPSYMCIATPKSNVGMYNIFVEVTSQNYDISYYYGILTVKPATLEVTALDISKYYGEENPEFTLNYFGFVNSENELVLVKKPVAQTSATSSSPVGQYPIYVSGGEAKNYEFIYHNGILSILPTDNGVENTVANNIEIIIETGYIKISNKLETSICRIFDLSGIKVLETYSSEIYGLSKGIYIVEINSNFYKIKL